LYLNVTTHGLTSEKPVAIYHWFFYNKIHDKVIV